MLHVGRAGPEGPEFTSGEGAALGDRDSGKTGWRQRATRAERAGADKQTTKPRK